MGYTSVESGTYDLHGQNYEAIFGVRPDGSKALMGIKVNGVMKQASEWSQGEGGYTGVVYFNPPADMRLNEYVSITEKAAEVYFNELFVNAGKQKGMSKEALMQDVIATGGKLRLEMPQQGLDDGGRWVEWNRPPFEVDMYKPVEVRISIGPKPEGGLFAEIDPRWVMKTYVNMGNGAEPANEGTLWSANDGHLVISSWGIAYVFEILPNGVPNKELIESRLITTLQVIRTMGHSQDWRAFHDVSWGTSFTAARDIFYVSTVED